MLSPDREQRSRAREYALKLLDYRERSVYELKERLRLKDFDNKIISGIIEDFKRLGLIDDNRFARLWVRSRLNSRPKAAFLLGIELARKGISRNIIEATLSELVPEQVEKDTIMSLARAQVRRYQREEPAAARRKLWGYLARRGYRSELIVEVIKKLESDESARD